MRLDLALEDPSALVPLRVVQATSSMVRAAAFVIELFVAMLPNRYRQWWPQSEDGMVPAALASGLILMATAFLLFCARYLIFFQRRVVELGMQILNSPESNVPVYGVGIVASGEYMTQPTTWLLIFATIDSAFRFLAALSVGEVVPTLPLYPVVWIHGRLDAWAAEKKLGPIVPDRVQAVERKAYDVLVGASRKKAGVGHAHHDSIPGRAV